jgi:hypothetical protein
MACLFLFRTYLTIRSRFDAGASITSTITSIITSATATAI